MASRNHGNHWKNIRFYKLFGDFSRWGDLSSTKVDLSSTKVDLSSAKVWHAQTMQRTSSNMHLTWFSCQNHAKPYVDNEKHTHTMHLTWCSCQNHAKPYFDNENTARPCIGHDFHTIKYVYIHIYINTYNISYIIYHLSYPPPDKYLTWFRFSEAG